CRGSLVRSVRRRLQHTAERLSGQRNLDAHLLDKVVNAVPIALDLVAHHRLGRQVPCHLEVCNPRTRASRRRQITFTSLPLPAAYSLRSATSFARSWCSRRHTGSIRRDLTAS